MAKTKAEMQAIFKSVSNWGRWGAEDERGTLNYLTPERTAAAARLVRSGQSISCARNFPVQPGPENPTPALHHIVVGGDDPCAHGIPGMEVSLDFIGIAYHGLASSHIDALCHVFVDGKMYNGFPATDVRSTGARRNSIMSARDGLVGRGVLLDIPRLRGTAYVDPAKPVTPAELDAAEKAQGVKVGEGDILLVMVGRDAWREHNTPNPGEGPPLAGLSEDCVLWLFQRRIAVLGSDAVHDPTPSPTPIEDFPIPVHMCGLVSMGLHLLDNLHFVALAEACAEAKRWEFLFTVAPLRVERGTGSPVNPIAIL
ncbi:MAG: cyclase family protein [Proteobacteria bacterium]|nr:cyclase family protein [Pseudomonadota bacterium]